MELRTRTIPVTEPNEQLQSRILKDNKPIKMLCYIRSLLDKSAHRYANSRRCSASLLLVYMVFRNTAYYKPRPKKEQTRMYEESPRHKKSSRSSRQHDEHLIRFPLKSAFFWFCSANVHFMPISRKYNSTSYKHALFKNSLYDVAKNDDAYVKKILLSSVLTSSRFLLTVFLWRKFVRETGTCQWVCELGHQSVHIAREHRRGP